MNDVNHPEVAAAIDELRRQALATGLMNDPVEVTTLSTEPRMPSSDITSRMCSRRDGIP